MSRASSRPCSAQALDAGGRSRRACRARGGWRVWPPVRPTRWPTGCRRRRARRSRRCCGPCGRSRRWGGSAAGTARRSPCRRCRAASPRRRAGSRAAPARATSSAGTPRTRCWSVPRARSTCRGSGRVEHGRGVAARVDPGDQRGEVLVQGRVGAVRPAAGPRHAGRRRPRPARQLRGVEPSAAAMSSSRSAPMTRSTAVAGVGREPLDEVGAPRHEVVDPALRPRTRGRRARRPRTWPRTGRCRSAPSARRSTSLVPTGRWRTTAATRSWPSVSTSASTTTGSPTTRLAGNRPPATCGVDVGDDDTAGSGFHEEHLRARP